VAIQPARELGLIRLLKLVEHPPRMIQIAPRLLIGFLDFFPDGRAIRQHQRAAVVGRLGIGNGMAAGRFYGRAAWHKKAVQNITSTALPPAIFVRHEKRFPKADHPMRIEKGAVLVLSSGKKGRWGGRPREPARRVAKRCAISAFIFQLIPSAPPCRSNRCRSNRTGAQTQMRKYPAAPLQSRLPAARFQPSKGSLSHVTPSKC
jgi:hypothetical protein